MTYKISDIEGIGSSFADKLGTAKIRTTDDLLEHCCTPTGRKAIAQATGISESKILDWTNMADMMRVSGIGGQYAELLKAAGVDTVKELRTRNASNLADKLNAINAQKKLTKGQANESTVEGWIQKAKSLDAKIQY